MTLDRCADCSAPMPERAEACGCAERRCETCWWTWCRAEHAAGRPIPAVALTRIERGR